MTSSSASAFLALSLRSHGSHTLLMTAAIVAVYLRLREEEEKKKRKKKKKKRDHEETTASWEGTISSSESLPKMARTNHILRRHDRAAAVPVPQSIRVPIKPKATGRMAIPRVRKTIGHIHEQLGPAHFRRVYNLSLEEFRQLLRCIEPQLNQRKTTLRGRNGPVPFDTALSATLRFLRGDAVPQIMESHGVSRATLYDTLWQTIAAINECPALAFSSSAHHTVSPCHPDAEQQLQPQTTSPAGGEYRAECLGGMILSIDKPRQIDDYHYQHHRAAAASSSSALDGRHDIIMTTTTTTTNTNGPKTNPRHYYYYYYAGKGRKPTYGFNLQAICDAHGRFLTVSIQHPAAISKRASFRTSLSLTATTNTNNNNMTDGTGLAQNLAILGHSSCAVTAAAAVAATDDGTGGLSHPSITTPYISTTGGRNTSQSGARADFNYYHSQLRMTIDQAFHALIHHWGILQKPLSSTMGGTKQIALAYAACRLYNYCITLKLPLASVPPPPPTTTTTTTILMDQNADPSQIATFSMTQPDTMVRLAPVVHPPHHHQDHDCTGIQSPAAENDPDAIEGKVPEI